MAWLSRINFTSADVLSYASLNNLGNDIRSWGGNVNAGGYTLSNVTLSGLNLSNVTLTNPTVIAPFTVTASAGGATLFTILANGNVGVGANPPLQSLAVGPVASMGSAGSKNAAIGIATTKEIWATEGNNAGAYLKFVSGVAYLGAWNYSGSSSPLLKVQPDGGDTMYSGNVAIGATGPFQVTAGRAYLTIKGSAFSGTLEFATSQAAADGVALGLIQATDITNTANADKRVAAALIVQEGITANNLGASWRFFTKPDGGPAFIERLRIDSRGRVGINATGSGAASASAPLDVKGLGDAAAASYNCYSVARFSDGGAASHMAVTFDTGSTGSLATRGFVFIKSTQDMHIARFDSNGAGGYTSDVLFSSNGNVLLGYASSNGAYRLQVNSQIFATSATIATSDGRYKEAVAPLVGALDIVNALRPVTFDWKKHPLHDFPAGRAVGFIAQELSEALVAAEADYAGSIVKSNSCSYVKDGDNVSEEFMGVADTNLIPLLAGAIQELTARLERLENKN